MISKIFSYVLEAAFAASVIALIVIILRILLRKRLPSLLFVFLWGIVLFRLFSPVSIPSPTSAFNAVDSKGVPAAITQFIPDSTIMSKEIPTVSEKVAVTPTEQSTEYPQTIPVIDPTRTTETKPSNHGAGWITAAPFVWAVGFLFMLVFYIAVYVRLGRIFAKAEPVKNEEVSVFIKNQGLRRKVSVYRSGQYATPLVYGIIHPKILLPYNFTISDTVLTKHILTHEFVHIRQFDNLYKLIFSVGLCLHWFNPFVWVSYLLFQKDIESACDERVLRLLGEENRAMYADTLYKMAVRSALPSLTFTAFGEGDTLKRIKLILKYKKASVASVMVAILVAATNITLFATDAIIIKQANEAISPFKKNIPYHNEFYDVQDKSPFYDDVATAYSYGIIAKSPNHKFNPFDNLTIAEAVTFAARIRCFYNGDSRKMLEPLDKAVWYSGSIAYFVKYAVPLEQFKDRFNKPATRADAAYILSYSLPEIELLAINPAITDLFQVERTEYYYDRLLLLCQAGVLNDDGSFNDLGVIKRFEIAAILVRLIEPDDRIQIKTLAWQVTVNMLDTDGYIIGRSQGILMNNDGLIFTTAMLQNASSITVDGKPVSVVYSDPTRVFLILKMEEDDLSKLILEKDLDLNTPFPISKTPFKKGDMLFIAGAPCLVSNPSVILSGKVFFGIVIPQSDFTSRLDGMPLQNGLPVTNQAGELVGFAMGGNPDYLYVVPVYPTDYNQELTILDISDFAGGAIAAKGVNLITEQNDYPAKTVMSIARGTTVKGTIVNLADIDDYTLYGDGKSVYIEAEFTFLVEDYYAMSLCDENDKVIATAAREGNFLKLTGKLTAGNCFIHLMPVGRRPDRETGQYTLYVK